MANFASLQLNKTFIKKVVAGLVTAGLLIAAGLLLLDWLSYRTVKFTLSPETTSIVVYSTDQYQAYNSGESADTDAAGNSGELKSTGVLRLKVGTYQVIPAGDKVSDSAIKIEVKGDTDTVDIKPYYSTDYLDEHFSDQIPAINSVIADKYNNIIANYVIEDGRFYHNGDWYGTTLYNQPTRGAGSDTYGVILHRVDGTWQIAATPELLFRYSDHTDIPRDILDAVNQSAND